MAARHSAPARGRRLLLGLMVTLIGALSPAAEARQGDLRGQFREREQAFFEAQAEGDFEAMERIAREQRDLLSEARRDLRAQNAAQSRDPAVLKDLATVLAMEGDYDLAAETLERAADHAPDDAESWVMLGEMRMHLGDAAAPDAAEALRQCLALEPGGPIAAHAHGLMTALYLEMGLIPLARETREEGQQFEEGHPALEFGAIALDIAEGRLVEAHERLDTHQTLPRRTSDLIERAVELYETSGRATPNTAEAHTAYARILFRVGQAHRCAAPLERAVTLDPEDTAAWNFLGSVYLTLGDYESAQHAFAQSLGVDGEQPGVREIVEALEDGEPVAPDDEEAEEFVPPVREQSDEPASPFMGMDVPTQN
ncbi:MAG: tetratricopeptide repeat protein [Candidatus Hydrogenedentota bacterium]